jgi:acetylornithine/succinyldiaminopimelate/putrescine aminotransferase
MTQEVANVMEPGDHGSTFAGGLLVAKVARAVLNHINNPEFLELMQANSQYLETRLRDEVGASPLIEGVRGKGLMWGLLSVPPAGDVVTEARNHGLIILVAGPNVIRLLPPLTISKDEIDLLVDRLLKTLEALG